MATTNALRRFVDRRGPAWLERNLMKTRRQEDHERKRLAASWFKANTARGQTIVEQASSLVQRRPLASETLALRHQAKLYDAEQIACCCTRCVQVAAVESGTADASAVKALFPLAGRFLHCDHSLGPLIVPSGGGPREAGWSLDVLLHGRMPLLWDLIPHPPANTNAD